MRLYYFVSANYGIENIIKQRLKIARLNDLNDPFEFLCVDMSDTEIRQVFKKTLSDLSETTGVICFSKAWGNPVLWSHYGDKHKGICLGFDIPDEIVMPVNYEPNRLQVDIRKDFKDGVIGEKMMQRVLSTKFEDWKYEDEVRVFVRLDEKDSKTGLYYQDYGEGLLLKEVIIGPKCHFTIFDFKSILAKNNSEVNVISSRLAFRSFRVIGKKAVVRKRIKKKNA
jgi:hypothetical protein